MKISQEEPKSATDAQNIYLDTCNLLITIYSTSPRKSAFH